MEERIEDSRVRLQRLWKGTLFVGIAGGYVLLLVLLFIHHGWRAALLAVFFIALSQFFRYIANDVDRIGWSMARQPGDETGGEATRRYQVRMLYLLVGLAQVQNIALICQAYLLAGVQRAVGTLAALAFIEVLYVLVRKVNRTVEFEQASYGFRDRGVFTDGPESITAAEKVRHDKLERKLDRLKEMAEQGRISQQAFEKACDKYRVRGVMDDGDAPPRRG